MIDSNQPAVPRGEQVASVIASISRGRCVVLTGPAGIGKTTLASRALRGLDVVSGRCLAVLSDRQYSPLSDARRRATAGPFEEVAAELYAEIDGRTLRLEDVHWADDSTLAVLGHLLGRVPMLLTSRVEPPWGAHDAVDVVPVRPLHWRTAMSLAMRLHPMLTEHQREQLVRFAGGNPLLLRYLASNERVSGQLADAVADRLDWHSGPTADGVRMLAVHGRPVRAGIVGLTADEGLGGLLRSDQGLVWFSHDQFASAILDRLDRDARRALRVRLASRCEDVDAAVHYYALGDGERAAASARRAAQQTDTSTRADMLRLAVKALGVAAPLALRIEAADALLLVHRPSDVVALLDAHDHATNADAGLRLVRALWMEGKTGEAVERVDQILTCVGDAASPPVTRLVVERAQMLVRVRVGDPAIVGIAATALELAQRSGIETARAQNALGLALSHSGQPGWEEHFRAASEAARATGDVEEEFAANYWLVSALGFYGPILDALKLSERMLRESRSLGLHRWSDHYLAARAVHLSACGRLPDDELEGCRELLDRHPHFRNRAQVELVLAISHLDRDAAAAAIDVIHTGRRFARNDEDRSLLCCAELEVALAQRDVELAAAALERLESCGTGFFGLNALAESAAIHVMLDDPRRVELPMYTTMLTPLLDVVRDERAAFDAYAAGQLGRAADGFAAAANGWCSRSLPRLEVRALASAVQVRMIAGDVGRARSLLGRAEVTSDRHGGLSVRRLAELRRSLEHRAVAALVTGRELEVLQLVAAGLSRRAIAVRLGIELTTVNSHLRSVMRKLGSRTSAQAAAEVSAFVPSRIGAT